MVLAASLAGFEYGFNGKTDLFACFCAVCFFALWIGLMRKFRDEEIEFEKDEE
jgi:hypothetical protein